MDNSKFRDPMFFSLLSLSLVLKIVVSLKKRVVRLNSFNENYCCYWYDYTFIIEKGSIEVNMLITRITMANVRYFIFW